MTKLNLRRICAAFVTAVFTVLTFSVGARPQDPQPVIDRQQHGLTASGKHGVLPRAFDKLDRQIFDKDVAPGFNAESASASPDSLGSTSTHYSLRPDLRRCVSPLCGGYFVKRVNHSLTRCANGRYAAECYVAEINWAGQPDVEPRGALLRGKVVAKIYARFGNLGAFRVSESWQAASDNQPTGTYYRVKDRGVRCITFPCPTHHEAKLNSTFSQNIAGVDLNGAAAKEEMIAEASRAMTETDGVLVAGSHTLVTGPAGRAHELKATQFYLRGRKQISNKPCFRTGCSSQVCADENVITTCEWRPEYACYQKARCERQANGACGFTRTPELIACLQRK